MGARRAGRSRRGGALLAAAAAVVVTVAVVAAGVARDTGSSPQPRARLTPAGTPLAGLDLSGLPIVREPFCDRLDRRAVTAALGAPVAENQEYADGQRAALTDTLTDVAHEFGCSFRAADGTTARAWVFAAPVTSAQARRMVRSVQRQPRCVTPAGAPTFGRPGVSVLCDQRDESALSTRGLFGDTWLSCELTVPSDAGTAGAAGRGMRWCVHVATALGARP